MESALLLGLIDFVRIGEGPLVRLRRINPRITPLAQQVSGGKTSVVFVAASSPFQKMEDLRGVRFAAGNRTSSSSGYKLREQFLNAGLRAADLQLVYQANAEGNLDLVAEGKYAAGVTRRDKLRGSWTKRVRIVCEFPTTTMPWAARGDLALAVADAFAEALVVMRDPNILAKQPDDAREGFRLADPCYFAWLDHEIRTVEEEFGDSPSESAPGEEN
jgi:ABC-type phosphate/phosphonate transport system substrate-binding protein